MADLGLLALGEQMQSSGEVVKKAGDKEEKRRGWAGALSGLGRIGGAALGYHLAKSFIPGGQVLGLLAKTPWGQAAIKAGITGIGSLIGSSAGNWLGGGTERQATELGQDVNVLTGERMDVLDVDKEAYKENVSDWQQLNRDTMYKGAAYDAMGAGYKGYTDAAKAQAMLAETAGKVAQARQGGEEISKLFGDKTVGIDINNLQKTLPQYMKGLGITRDDLNLDIAAPTTLSLTGGPGGTATLKGGSGTYSDNLINAILENQAGTAPVPSVERLPFAPFENNYVPQGYESYQASINAAQNAGSIPSSDPRGSLSGMIGNQFTGLANFGQNLSSQFQDWQGGRENYIGFQNPNNQNRFSQFMNPWRTESELYRGGY